MIPSYYRYRINNPCGKCYKECKADKNDSIRCNECTKTFHRTCVNITEERQNELKNTRSLFFCSRNCESSVLPFHNIKDKLFSKTVIKRGRFPCSLCKHNCNKQSKRLFCEKCLRWTHFECSKITDNQYRNFKLNPSFFNCSRKCELSALPFHSLQDRELLLTMVNFSDMSQDSVNKVLSGTPGYVAPNNHIRDLKIAAKNNCCPQFYELENQVYCEYLDPNDIADIMTRQKRSPAFTAFHGNLISLNKNIHLVEELFHGCDEVPDIIGISETKLNDNADHTILPGYKFEGMCSETDAGGVGVYINNVYSYDVRDDLCINVDKCEEIWVEVHTSKRNSAPPKNDNLVVAVLYRHPGSQYTEFRDKLCATVDTLNKSKTRYVVLGDINIDLLKYNLTKNVTEYLNELQSAGCLSYINKPTRFKPSLNNPNGTCIDHVYSNIDQENVENHVIYSDISDHFSTLTRLSKIPKKITPPRVIYKRKKYLSPNATIQFCNELKEALCSTLPIMRDSCPNKRAKYIVESYQKLIDKFMPLKKLTKKQLCFYHKPWISKGLRKSIKRKHTLFRKSVKLGTSVAIAKYKQYSNMLTKLKTVAYKNFYSNKFNDVSADKGKTWRVINEITQRKRKERKSIHCLRDKKGNKITSPKDIANNFNAYFNSVGHSLASKIPSSQYPPLHYIKTQTPNSLFLNNTFLTEVTNIINSLDCKKSPGSDRISNYIIKTTKDIIAPVLVGVYNECLNKGIFPEIFKIAKIIPLYKGDDATKNSNYRPISLLPQFGKIFEKIISKRLISFLDKYSLLNKHQFGFRKNFSTELAVANIQDKFLDNLDNNIHTCAIFLDLAKAFDTVDNNILISKLSRYGIRGTPLKLIESYLERRQHFVSIDEHCSELLEIDIGVPQGSVLGPLLFLIYINDLPEATNLSVKLFADDTLLSMGNRELATLQTAMNIELKKVHEWLIANKLTLNTDKSKYMIISKRKVITDDEFKLSLNDTLLERCHSYKYLGVFIDDKLSWEPHIDYVCQKISKTCRFLTKLRHYLDTPMLRTVYYALVFPYIRYCNTSWGNAAQIHMEKLNRLHNKVIKIIAFAPYRGSDVTQIFFDLELLPTDEIYTLEVGKLMYKYKQNLLPKVFDGYFTTVSQTHGHFTRSSARNDYRAPQARSNYGLNRLKNEGVKIWNGFSAEIRNSGNIKQFITNVKTNLLCQR